MYQGFLQDAGILFYFILIRFLAKKSDSVFLIRLAERVIFWQGVTIIYPLMKFLKCTQILFNLMLLIFK